MSAIVEACVGVVVLLYYVLRCRDAVWRGGVARHSNACNAINVSWLLAVLCYYGKFTGSIQQGTCQMGLICSSD